MPWAVLASDFAALSGAIALEYGELPPRGTAAVRLAPR